MSKTITISVPHRLSPDEARQRIQAGIEDFGRQFAGQVGNVQQAWTGNHVEGRCQVLGQTLTGRADVEVDRVLIQVDLPWLLARLANLIQPQLEDRATRLLER